MTSHRRFDVIIFGVTGFLGRYTCEQFARKGSKRSINWAVAGRDKKKIMNVLRKVSVEVGRDFELTTKFEADCSDPAALIKMCKECKVLVNCVGPYVDYGEYVVKACLETGTHYIDACVEPYFLEDIQCRYNRAANSKNVFIIQSCGFSTLLFEMGLMRTIAKFDGAINSCEMFTKVIFSRYGHRLNFSVFKTIVAIIENNVRYSRVSNRLKREMFPKTSDTRYGLPNRSRIFTEAYRSVVNGYCLNVRSGELSTLKRTQMWLHEKDDLKPIQVRTFYIFNSWYYPALWFVLLFLILFLRIFGLVFWVTPLLLRYFSCGVFNASKGPTRQQILNTESEIYFCCEGWKNVKQSDPQPHWPPDSVIVTKFEAGDPFYVLAPKCLYHSTVTMLNEQSKISKKGGVFTPGVAFRNTSLIEKILKDGVKFDVVKEYKKVNF